MLNTNDCSDDGGVVPPMRPCSSATTVSNRRAERAERRRGASNRRRRVSFSSTDNLHVHTGKSSFKVPQSPGGESASYISLGGDSSEDETIHSSSFYSLHNYSPAIKKEERKKRRASSENAPKNEYLFCPASLTLDDIKEEVEGTIEDAVESLMQVWYAFVITDDDIDGMADTIHHATDEVVAIELERRWRSVRKMESRF